MGAASAILRSRKTVATSSPLHMQEEHLEEGGLPQHFHEDHPQRAPPLRSSRQPRQYRSRKSHSMVCCSSHSATVMAFCLILLLLGLSFSSNGIHLPLSFATTTYGSAIGISTGSMRLLEEVAPTTASKEEVYDMVIVGAGPAGLTAALFGGRSGLRVLVLGSSSTGLLSETTQLENFPSFFQQPSLTGPAWLGLAKAQAVGVGAKFVPAGILATDLFYQPTTTAVSESSHNGEEDAHHHFVLQTTASKEAFPAFYQIHARSVVLATGATPRQLELPNENRLWGNSLHNCVLCDGHLYASANVLVVGGGDAALEAALYLSRLATKVTLVHRRTSFSSASDYQSLQAVLETSNNIDVLTPFVVEEWKTKTIGNSKSGEEGAVTLEAAVLRHADPANLPEGQESAISLSVDGAFVMIGATPNTEWLQGAVDMDADGYVVLSPALSSSRRGSGGSTQTSVPGVFAVGEVADKMYKQAITASAEGAQAAIDAERWLRDTYGVQQQNKRLTSNSNNRSRDFERVVQEQSTVLANDNLADANKKAEPERTQMEQEQPDDHDRIVDCDLTTEECIQQTVKSHPVVVFSKPWCPYCRKAIEALSLAGAPNPLVIDLSQFDQTQDIQRQLQKMTGRRTVPNVFVGGTTIGGGDETAAFQAHGQLAAMIEQAEALFVVKEGTTTSRTTTTGRQKKNDELVILEQEKKQPPIAKTDDAKEYCDLAELTCIEELIHKKYYKGVLFSLSWCPECKRTLELLSSIGVHLDELPIIDLDDYKPIAQDIRYHLMTISDRRSVPNLFLGGENFGGYKKTTKLHQQGKLIAKLDELGWSLGAQTENQEIEGVADEEM